MLYFVSFRVVLLTLSVPVTCLEVVFKNISWIVFKTLGSRAWESTVATLPEEQRLQALKLLQKV